MWAVMPSTALPARLKVFQGQFLKRGDSPESFGVQSCLPCSRCRYTGGISRG